MINERIRALRAALVAQNLAGFIVPRGDEFLGEYTPPSAERLAWISGFTGSAGLAIILADKAAIFSDGRYTTQLTHETDAAIWQRHHIIETPPETWLAAQAAGQVIGYDPWLISADGLARFTKAGLTMLPVTVNPLDQVWTDRPAPPMAPAVPHDLAFAGEDSAAKRARIAAILSAEGEDAAMITDAHSIAWLFNMRGGDLEFTPIALGFSILRADGSACLFMDAAKLSPQMRAHLGNQVQILPREALPAALDGLAGKTIRLDPAASAVWFETRLRAAGASIAAKPDPSILPRALKNPTEQAGARAAHQRDAQAMCRFLAWLDRAAPSGQETEISAASALLGFRRAAEMFRGESFPAISGAGPHGAIMHYRATASSDRPINPNEVYLIDSGGQYNDGTTDITRTIWTGPDAPPARIADIFTRVLAGHIALAQAIFPDGVAGPHLDSFARASLWQAGLDYDHGTGHGVGSFLSVHEGPAGISRASRPVKLQPGMILSNEPGYYEPAAEGSAGFGIRLENLLLVVDADLPGPKKFYRFETLTFAPFDRRLIVPSLLTPSALAWLNDYHAAVFKQVSPSLDATASAFLQAACAPI